MTTGLANREMPLEPQKRPLMGRNSSKPVSSKINKSPFAAPQNACSPAGRLSPEILRGRITDAAWTPKSGLRDDLATPVKAFLSSNITPRSSARKGRVASISSTPNQSPNGTPNISRLEFLTPVDGLNIDDGFSGLGMTGLGNSQSGQSGSVVSESNGSGTFNRGVSPARSAQTRTTVDRDSSPMFFHASDAKSIQPTKSTPRRPGLVTKTSTFVYANGEVDLDVGGSSMSTDSNCARDIPSPWTSPVTVSPSGGTQSGFFHASDLFKSRPPSITSRPTATTPVSSRSTPMINTFSPSYRAGQPRSASPLKDFEVARPSSSGTTSPQSYVSTADKSLGNPARSPPSVSSTVRTAQSRRDSLRPATKLSGDGKTASANPIEPKPLQPRLTRSKSLATDEATVSQVSRQPTAFVSEPKSLSSNSSSSQSPPSILPQVAQSPRSPLHSPTRSLHTESKLEQLNALAANARRERKVLDLEISNSSLLAINRTLEREMRKQNAELRRYRRLTSTGRLSIAPSHRSLSSRFSMTGSGNDDDSDTSEVDDPDNLLDLSSDDNSSVSLESMSPTALATHNARQRERDERRLQLDLSKHQELLVDSQRINQGLKRCLGWTEELIAEGRKALAYHVRISDIELGGRVLAPDELSGELGQRRGLLSPAKQDGDLEWNFPKAESEGGEILEAGLGKESLSG